MALNITVDTDKFQTAEFRENAGGLIRAFCEVKANTLDMYQFLKDEADNERFDGFYGLDDVFDLTPATGGSEYTGHKMRFFNLLGDFAMSALEQDSFGAGTNRSINFTQANFKYLLTSNTDFNATTYGGNLAKFRTAFSGVAMIPGAFLYLAQNMPEECWTETVTLPTSKDPEPGLMSVRPYLRKFKPKGLYRLRQLLSQIAADTRWDDYYEYDYIIEAHMEECDDCMEDPESCNIYNDLRAEQSALYNAIMAQLLDEFALGTEFDSYMADPYTSGTSATNYFNNPLRLIDVDTTARVVKQGASDLSTTVTVPCVTLLRCQALSGAQCFDSSESVFTAGNPNYVLSNYFTWLNDPHRKSKAWQVASHDADTFSTNSPYFGYLACCDSNLLRLLTGVVEANRKILTKNTLASGVNPNYYGLAYATILSAFEYGLTSGSACGTHKPIETPYYYSWSQTKYFASATNADRKPEIAAVGTKAAYLNLITKTALNMTTSSTYPYQLMGAIDSSGAFTGVGLTTYTTIQPAHYLVGFHLDKIAGAEAEYLRGVTLVS